MTVQLRAVEVADLPGVHSLIRESFEEALHPYMISTQAGTETYLRVFVEHAALYPDRRFLLAESPTGTLLGYAEFRLLEGHIGFLSYICVSSAARGRGVATRLIEQYLAATPEADSMQLDVFTHNHPARCLYRKLGFVEQQETIWWHRVCPPPQSAAGSGLRFDDLPSALAAWHRYGFCEWRGTFRGAPFRLGRMGAGVLRCFRADDMADDALLAGLRGVFPALTEVLAILPAGESPSVRATEINRSVRMLWAHPRPVETVCG